jgi:hypothetical protein
VKEAFQALALAVAALSCASALAGPAGAVATADGRTIITPGSAATPVVRRAPVPMGLKEIYSTFNTDPDDAYGCCSGWTVSAVGSIVGSLQDVAMPFTPSANYIATAINVGAGYVAGTNGVAITLNEDAGGVPGAEIKKGTVTGLPAFGTCCTTVSIGGGAGGAPVTAGTQYWVVVKTNQVSADTWNAWNHNNIGAIGTFAFNTGAGWQLATDTLSAFSVMGKAP